MRYFLSLISLLLCFNAFAEKRKMPSLGDGAKVTRARIMCTIQATFDMKGVLGTGPRATIAAEKCISDIPDAPTIFPKSKKSDSEVEAERQEVIKSTVNSALYLITICQGVGIKYEDLSSQCVNRLTDKSSTE